MQVNESAPVIVEREVTITAPASVIWGVLTGFQTWPSWNPDVSHVTVLGVVQEGTEFHWKTGMTSIHSTIGLVDEPRAVGWTGKTFGVEAAHVYELEGRGPRTLVKTKESWDGPLAGLLRAPIRKMLAKSLVRGLMHLKVESERRTGPLAV